jgi:hypothetical protein
VEQHTDSTETKNDNRSTAGAMKKLYLKTDNVYALAASNVNASTFIVTLTMVGEDGNVLVDNNGDALVLLSTGTSPKLTFDNTLKQFKGMVHFINATALQYARAFWVVTGASGNPVAVPGYYPEELSIENSPTDTTQTHTQLVVPASYFIDTFLASYPSISEELVQIIKEINTRNPDIFRNELLASQDALETEIRTKFFLTKFHVDRDLYDEDFRHSRWIQQVDWLPLYSVDHFKLIYGNNEEIILSNDIADSIKIDYNLGFLEWVPIVTSLTAFTMIISTLSGIAASSFGMDYSSRIPGLFRIDYTAGYDFPNLPSQRKERIRRLISRNCFCQIMPRIDTLMREVSLSQSIDGASLSKSSGIPKIIEQFQKDERNDIGLFQKELGSGVAVAVS